MLKKLLSTLCALTIVANTYSMQESNFELLPLELKLRILQHTVKPMLTNSQAFETVKNIMRASKSNYSQLAQSATFNSALMQDFAQKTQDLTPQARLLIAAAYLSTPGAQKWLRQRIEQNPETMKAILDLWRQCTDEPYDNILNFSRVRFLLNALSQQAATYTEESEQRTFLMFAASCNCVPALQFLLNSGAPIDQTDSSNDTALSYALPHAPVLEFLLKNNANPNVSDSNHNTVLMSAASNGNIPALKALIAAKAALDATDANGFTALAQAIWANRKQAAQLLIQAKAHIVDNYRFLCTSVQNGNREAVEMLLSEETFNFNSQELKELLDLAHQRLCAEDVKQLLQNKILGLAPKQTKTRCIIS